MHVIWDHLSVGGKAGLWFYEKMGSFSGGLESDLLQLVLLTVDQLSLLGLQPCSGHCGQRSLPSIT